jgi:hypothetical protein
MYTIIAIFRVKGAAHAPRICTADTGSFNADGSKSCVWVSYVDYRYVATKVAIAGVAVVG